MADVNYPGEKSWPGTQLVKFWAGTGEILRDMGPIFRSYNFSWIDRETGGPARAHLDRADKKIGPRKAEGA